MVGADTVQRPGGDAAVVRVHGTHKGLAMTTDVTPRYCKADPVEGGKQAIAEAYRNLCAVGATPLATTDCMNFGNPQRPEIMGQFVGCIDGMAEACKALDFPIVSGNVSLYNETKNDDGSGSAILPTPAIGGVGLIEDWTSSATIAFKKEGDVIWLVGGDGTHLGQSLWLRELHGREDGPPPPVDLAKERANGERIRSLIAKGTVNAVHDISDGGLLVAITEMALAGRLGALLDIEGDPALLFGEDQGRYIVAAQHGVDIPGARAIGSVAGQAVEIRSGINPSIGLEELRSAHEGFFPNLMGADAALA
jgi:phosphoribosylformylglycinamidine synthase